MNFRKITLALIAIIFFSLNVHADIYKWTDDEGQTHYSERKPAGVVNFEIVKSYKTHANYAKENSDETADAVATTEDGDEEAAPTKEAPVEEVLKKDPSLCKRATDNLDTLMRTPIVRMGGKVMTVDEKNKEIANLKEIQKVHCP